VPEQVLGPVTSTEHKDMSKGEVAGTVIGVLGTLEPPPLQHDDSNNEPSAGVTIIIVGAFFLIKKLRGRGRQVPYLRHPDSRKDSGTSGTTWPSPWKSNLWGAVSNGPRSTMSGFRKTNAKTNSEMVDELVQASYAAEGGYIPTEKSRRHQTRDLESQPPSPGSFLDENFLNEKSYAKLEGPWPFRKGAAPKASAAVGPKTPGPVARWLDGIRTPRQSTATAIPPALVPGMGQMATRWQPEPPLPGSKPQVVGGIAPLQPPAPAFAKGSARDTRMTETTTTSSSMGGRTDCI
jgi:hypothetical protein